MCTQLPPVEKPVTRIHGLIRLSPYTRHEYLGRGGPSLGTRPPETKVLNYLDSPLLMRACEHNINNTITMAIIHIIQFSFKPEVPKEQVDDVCRRILALKEECIHPTTKKPYIKSFVGGRESSAEGLQGGVTHIFVSEIESDEDRRYYIEKDPAHLDFIKFAGPLIQTARVVDFEPGKF